MEEHFPKKQKTLRSIVGASVVMEWEGTTISI